MRRVCRRRGARTRRATMRSLRDGLDLEVERDQREDEALQVLDEVVEYPQALGVLRVLHVEERADLGARECDVIVANLDLELLPPDAVRLRPLVVVLARHLGLGDDPLELVDDGF
eukprot:CAMPEP_0184125684 /NCGR_PEP_ID=MMETSP0974-20121125/25161_1 /TAXON_ID=483370 /ORGANISM="non described non described, Strain CCMP2097" /LENGTH=114 /DNA_ID=CAMNT_0026429023 /DNA_START=152 /DNA_END=496 /DNA_ORIENTATION=+